MCNLVYCRVGVVLCTISQLVSPTFGHANANCSVFIDYIYKKSISREMDNDNDLYLHSMTKLSGLLRYWSCYTNIYVFIGLGNGKFLRK